MESWYGFALGALCVWRVTHLLHAENGPWDLFAWLRRAAGRGTLGQALDCFYCLSLWVAASFALLLATGWRDWLLLVPALSGAAILAERVTTRSAGPPAAWYHEEEAKDVLLRQESDRPGHDDEVPPA